MMWESRWTMFVKFTEKAQKALVVAESSAYHLGYSEVTSEHLLLSLLKNSELTFTKVLKKYMVNDKKIMEQLYKTDNKSEIPYLEYTSELRNLLEEAMSIAYQKKVTADLLGYVLIQRDCLGRQLLQSYGVDLDYVSKKLKEKKENSLGGFVELIDLNDKVKKNKTKIIGREKELKLLVEMLCRKEKNNAIIVGDAGVGKTALVEKLACELNQASVNHPLFGRRVYELDLSSVLAGTKYRGDFEEKLKKIITAIKGDKKAIIFIDEIHNLVDAGKAEGAIDASNILKPYLARGEITCIGATTYKEYKKYFETDPALNRRFAKIDLKEENKEATFMILKGLKKDYEIFHQITIPDELIEYVIDMTSKHMKDRHQPDKSLDVLDLSCVRGRMQQEEILSKEIVFEVIESLCGYSLKDNQDIQKQLKEKIIGQDQAIEAFTKGLLSNQKNFLLMGTNGVGKTTLVKQTAKLLNAHLIVSHIQESQPIEPLLEEVSRYPQSLILLDDIQYIRPSIMQFFLKIMEDQEYEGVDFSHVRFILTTSRTRKDAPGFMKKKNHPEVLFPGLMEKMDVVVEFETFDEKKAREFLNHHQIVDEQLQTELLDCDYTRYGARILLKKMREKQSENSIQP